MNLLLNLIGRIASGERIEKGFRRSTTWWLSSLAVMPVVVILFTVFGAWVDRTTDYRFLDSNVGILLLTILFCLVTFAFLISCVRIFRGSPLWLVPVAAVTWTGGVLLACHHDVESPFSAHLEIKNEK